MKVKELIEKLKACNQDKDVIIYVSGKNHGMLSNIFINDVIEEDDDSDYNCVDLVV